MNSPINVKKNNIIDKNIINIKNQLDEQKDFFNSGKTLDVQFRIGQLKNLKNAINENEESILRALYKDLHKSKEEAYITEIALVMQEIDYAISQLKKWAKPKRAKNQSLYRASKSYIVHEPLGQVLIIGPWNYPFQLIIAPLVASISAGNVSFIKPSELAPHTSHIIKKIISRTFDHNYVYVAEGDRYLSQYLLSEKFDHIFFTGGIEIGKIVMKAASQNLTPVTLELGGKSPVIISDDADIDDAAKKIAWGKFLNAGQTCIAPDYILVHNSKKEELKNSLEHYINKFYGDKPIESPDYARIINTNHFNRLIQLLNHGKIIIGGEYDENSLFISPTIIDDVSLHHPIMKEEIFGPLLPIVEYDSIQDAISIVKSKTKPLALYLFTNNKKTKKLVLNKISSGGVVINDVLLHVGNHNLPFGGVGHSGIGSYHGKFGFEQLSHKKAVQEKAYLFNNPLRYPPYILNMKWLKKFI